MELVSVQIFSNWRPSAFGRCILETNTAILNMQSHWLWRVLIYSLLCLLDTALLDLDQVTCQTKLAGLFFPESGLWEPGDKSIIHVQAVQLAHPHVNPSFASFWR